jgi:hypothetical protein
VSIAFACSSGHSASTFLSLARALQEQRGGGAVQHHRSGADRGRARPIAAGTEREKDAMSCLRWWHKPSRSDVDAST